MKIKDQVLILLERKKRLAAVWLVFLMSVGSLFEVVGIASIPAFISLLGDPSLVLEYGFLERAYRFSGVTEPADFLLYAALGLIGVFVFKNIYLGLLSVFKAHFVYNTQHHVGTRLFEEYLNKPYAFHLKHNSAELLRNIKENASIVITSFLLSLVTIVMQLLNVVFIFTLLMVVEPIVSMVSMVALGGISFVFLMLIRKKNGSVW